MKMDATNDFPEHSNIKSERELELEDGELEEGEIDEEECEVYVSGNEEDMLQENGSEEEADERHVEKQHKIEARNKECRRTREVSNTYSDNTSNSRPIKFSPETSRNATRAKHERSPNQQRMTTVRSSLPNFEKDLSFDINRRMRMPQNYETKHYSQYRPCKNSDRFSGVRKIRSTSENTYRKSRPDHACSRPILKYSSMHSSINRKCSTSKLESNDRIKGGHGHSGSQTKKRENCFEDNNTKKKIKFDSVSSAKPKEQNYDCKKMQILLSEIKDKSPPEILQKLATNITELRLYLEREENLNYLELLPMLASAIDSNSSEKDKESLRNILGLTNFFERIGITTVLTEINVNAFSKTDLSQDEGLFISSLLSLLNIFCNKCKKNSIKAHLNLIKVILTNQRIFCSEPCSYDRMFGLLETVEKSFRNKTFQNTKTESRGMSQTDRQDMQGLLQCHILPKTMLEMRLETSLKIHSPDMAFQNDAEYLHVMFQLYKEDFFRPLKRGISNYIAHVRTHQTTKFRDDDVRVYTNVYLGEKQCNFDMGILQNVHFCRSIFKKTPGSGVLQYGNLVCFTNNQFEFIHFAMIAGRELYMIKQGTTSVLMLSDCEIMQNNNLVMIESKAFYTTYMHTLNAIRSIAHDVYKNYHRLPFGDQLVFLDKIIKEPAYTKDVFGRSRFVSFDCLLRTDIEIHEPKKVKSSHNFLQKLEEDERLKPYDSVPLLEMNTWPTQEQLGLDSSQYNALILALTKRLAIIQGPPGTGKTVIGLKIVSFLLSNQHLLKESKPIVLVSYTNHALDQFLNGIFDLFGKGNFPFKGDVIRVGSRSDDENIKFYNLKERQRELRRDCNAMNLRSILYRIRGDIEHEREKMRKFEEGILHEDYMYDINVLTYSQHSSMQRGCGTRIMENAIVRWLGVEDIFEAKARKIGSSDVFDENVIDEEMMREEDMDRMIDYDDDYYWLLKPTCSGYDDKRQKFMALTKNEITNTDLLPKAWRKLSQHKLNQILEYVLSEIRKNSVMEKEKAKKVYNVWEISLQERWRLYRYWVSLIKEPYVLAIEKKLDDFATVQRDYKKEMDIETVNILNRAKIIALTTTGAAKHSEILRQVAPSIIVVEEAAHMPEQHILGCLTSSTEHLILIGDHKQLKPQANDYRLSKTHPILEFSMLERLVTSEVQFQRLSYQHRMIPEISNFICPKFYSCLKNHESIEKKENIKGVTKNIVFVNHNELEEQSQNSHSYSNLHEAQLLTRLYKYLRQQGYSYKDITILSLYNDQVRLIRKLVRNLETEDSVLREEHEEIDEYHQSKKRMHRGVHVIAVDNFQGEENKIVLLSLVRSNKEGRVGYVKNQNRMCVALTRAKEGLFVVGNLNMMRKVSKWNDLLGEAEKQGLLDDSIRLCCQSHPEVITLINKPADFDNVRDGGCNKPCNFQRLCGHTCDRKCHLQNEIHNMPCKKQCRRLLCDLGHRCQKYCFEACGPCRERVTKIIPSCGHDITIACCENANNALCKMQCEKKLTCGHRCQKKCGEICNTEENCNELVKVTPKCGHIVQIACCEQRLVICKIPCNKDLPCGHKCKGTCGSCSNGRLHIPCREKCSRILICGHICTSKCSNVCPPCNRQCKRRCVHLGDEYCRMRCGESCIPCRETCQWKCDKRCTNHYSCTKDCHEVCDRPRCNNPCKKLRKCGHQCCGLCGEPCPSLCRVCDKEQLTEIFFGTEDDENAQFIELQDCKHIFEVSGMDQFMDMEHGTDDVNEIVEKVCPRCKTPIQRSYRYGIIVKSVLKDINKVKQIQNQKEPREICLDLCITKDNILEIGTKHNFKKHFHFIYKDITIFLDKECERSRGFQHSMKTSKLIDSIVKVFREAIDKSLKSNVVLHETMEKHFLVILKWLCIQRHCFSEFELEQFSEELSRFSYLAEFLLLHQGIKERENCEITDQEKQDIEDQLQNLQFPKEKYETVRIRTNEKKFKIKPHTAYVRSTAKVIYGREKLRMKEKPSKKLGEEKLDTDAIKEIFETLRDKVPVRGLGISDEDRKMILKAMGFQQKGHWYKCKNGHIYAIGECGGAMVKAKCPECSDEIGGSSHRLTESNTVATEMDGATYSAWSEQANMENYIL